MTIPPTMPPQESPPCIYCGAQMGPQVERCPTCGGMRTAVGVIERTYRRWKLAFIALVLGNIGSLILFVILCIAGVIQGSDDPLYLLGTAVFILTCLGVLIVGVVCASIWRKLKRLRCSA